MLSFCIVFSFVRRRCCVIYGYFALSRIYIMAQRCVVAFFYTAGEFVDNLLNAGEFNDSYGLSSVLL